MKLCLDRIVVSLVLVFIGGPAPAAATSGTVAALKAPGNGAPVPVAFLISDGAVVIDFTGPWEVFQDAETPGSGGFQLFTVSATREPVRTSGGLQIVPDYTFATAPPASIVVIPAQRGFKDPATQKRMLDWVRKTAEHDDLTMSVCNGVFTLAETGLLDGKSAAAFHNSWKKFEAKYPNVHLERGARFVEHGRLATAGGLSSGIDLALHVVERYFGRAAAEKTAFEMEYQGIGWKDPQSNAAYVTYAAAQERTAAATHARIDPVCGMAVEAKNALTSTYEGKTYFFCSEDDKIAFDATPERFLK
jgi:transcriptional regulator GlxA family with amidase domain/YHS domain-containing protein